MVLEKNLVGNKKCCVVLGLDCRLDCGLAVLE
jgi:hypothetical protein